MIFELFNAIKIKIDNNNIFNLIDCFIPKEIIYSSELEIDITIEVIDEINISSCQVIMKKFYYDNSGMVLIIKNKKVKLSINEKLQLNILVEKDINYNYLETFIHDIIRIKSLFKEVLFLHSSTILDKNNNTHTFVSWANTGKTRMMLAMKEVGMEPINDEWSPISKNVIYPIKSDLTLMYYDVKVFPTIFKINKKDKYLLHLYENLPNNIFKKILKRLKILKGYIKIPHDIAFSNIDRKVNKNYFYFLENNNNNGFSKYLLQSNSISKKYVPIFKREHSEILYTLNIFNYCFPTIPLNENVIEEKLKQLIEENLLEDDIFHINLPLNYRKKEILNFCEGFKNDI